MPQVVAPPGIDLGFAAIDGSPTRVRVLCGAGDPNQSLQDGIASSAVGSIFLRNDGSTGTCLYVKESLGVPGSAGTWTPK
jgi:hypothetical protein